jgi:hypothetical protein
MGVEIIEGVQGECHVLTTENLCVSTLPKVSQHFLSASTL